MLKSPKDIIQNAVLESGKELKLDNVHDYPSIEKVVVHMGIGNDRTNQSLVNTLKDHIFLITGQKPAIRKAKKSIASFKVRAGDPVGLIATLRGQKMYNFLYKLINITLPSIRDFRGLSDLQFDNQGNYNIGIKEHTVFPEISYSGENVAHGIQVTITCKTNDKKDSKILLEKLQFPFANKGDK